MRHLIALVAAAIASASPSGASTLPADALVGALDDPRLAALLGEVLADNPSIAAARARARAAEARPAQAGARPDPVASVTAFLLQPETRVGPQQLALSLSQRFPGFDRLELSERAAVEAAVAAGARLEEARLVAVTEARRWYYELAFHDEHESVLRRELELLRHFEEVARSRYAAGVGLQAAPLQLQAEVTRMEVELLRVEQSRRSAIAALNALRGRAPGEPVGGAALPEAVPAPPAPERLVEAALAARPSLAAAAAEIEAAGTRLEVARRAGKPSFTVGLGYTLVGRRDDPAGRAQPPRGNGDDIVSVTTAVNLPVRRRAIAAGVEEAAAGREAARQERRWLVAALSRDAVDLGDRVRLLGRQLELFEGVLSVQAEEALQSVQDAYSTGSTGSLDLLDATRVLYDVELATARTRADRAIALARLEGLLGAPLRDAREEARP
jgi:outer membrane protein TolC